MARNKSIPDDRLIALIHSYFTIECKKDVTKLKFPDITAYITAHGYPDYQVTTLRRTQAAREYIESLKEAEEKTAAASLSKQTAKASVELAKEHIKQTLNNNPELHAKFINEGIDELDRIKLL